MKQGDSKGRRWVAAKALAAVAVCAVAVCAALYGAVAGSGNEAAEQDAVAYADDTTSSSSTSGDTPVALVYNLEPVQVDIYGQDGYGVTPDFIYVFEATEDDDTAKDSYYADWVAEFVVTFDFSGANSSQLSTWKTYGSAVIVAGQYDAYSKTAWLPITLTSVTEGTEYMLMSYVYEELGTYYAGIDYLELCGIVKTFKCGSVQSVSESNAESSVISLVASSFGGSASNYYVPDGMVMTVELRLYESFDKKSGAYGNYVTVGSYRYTFGE